MTFEGVNDEKFRFIRHANFGKKNDKIIKIYPLLCLVKKEARAVKYKLTTAAKEEMGALQALTLCLRKRAFFFG